MKKIIYKIKIFYLLIKLEILNYKIVKETDRLVITGDNEDKYYIELLTKKKELLFKIEKL
jgi:hypothetical protein